MQGNVRIAIDGDEDMKMSSFHQSRKLIPIHSVNNNSRRFDSYMPEIILYQLQTQAALYLWCAEDWPLSRM